MPAVSSKVAVIVPSPKVSVSVTSVSPATVVVVAAPSVAPVTVPNRRLSPALKPDTDTVALAIGSESVSVKPLSRSVGPVCPSEKVAVTPAVSTGALCTVSNAVVAVELVLAESTKVQVTVRAVSPAAPSCVGSEPGASVKATARKAAW